MGFQPERAIVPKKGPDAIQDVSFAWLAGKPMEPSPAHNEVFAEWNKKPPAAKLEPAALALAQPRTNDALGTSIDDKILGAAKGQKQNWTHLDFTMDDPYASAA